MSEMTPTDPTKPAKPTKPTTSIDVVKDQQDPESGTDSHVAGHGEDD
jgi:hypothetical protein